MNNKQKFEANEEKEERVRLSRGLCDVCNKHCGELPVLAHRIPKGYVDMYGPEIIHHRYNMALVWSEKCNSAALLNPSTHPIEAQALVWAIREDLKS